MTSSSTGSAPAPAVGQRQLARWVMACIPLLSVAMQLGVEAPPRSFATETVLLTGSWRAAAGVSEAVALAEGTDDSAWAQVTLPGRLPDTFSRAPVVWLRRTVEVPGPLAAQPLTLLLGNNRTSNASLFINGAPVGVELVTPARLRPISLSSWPVAAGLVREGKNIVVIRLEMIVLGDGGLTDPRLILGATSAVAPYAQRNVDFDTLLNRGMPTILLVLLVLLTLLRGLDRNPGRKTLYVLALVQLGSGTVYLLMMTSYSALALMPSVQSWLLLLFGSLVGMYVGFLGTLEEFWTERVSRIGLALMMACGAYVVVLVVLFAVGTPEVMFASYTYLSPLLLVGIVRAAYLSVTGALKRNHVMGPAIACAAVIVGAAAAQSMMVDLGLIAQPFLFLTALTNSTVFAGLVVVSDFLGIQGALDAARAEAVTDPLTGVKNRKGYELALQRAQHEHAVYREPSCLLMIDIDRFKEINDTWGHGVGDEALRVLTRLLSETFPRRSDVVARAGGDEFAVVLRHAEQVTAETLAHRLVSEVAKLVFIAGGTRVPLSISVGVGSLMQGDTVGMWTERVDRALYEAKQSGRGKAVGTARR